MYTFSITAIVISCIGFMMLYRINVLDAAACRIVDNCAVNKFDLGRLVIIARRYFVAFALVREQITKRFNIQRWFLHFFIHSFIEFFLYFLFSIILFHLITRWMSFHFLSKLFPKKNKWIFILFFLWILAQ